MEKSMRGMNLTVEVVPQQVGLTASKGPKFKKPDNDSGNWNWL
jgi:hypothetical protein